MAEWLKAAVLKTVERLRVPGVRIPLSPPLIFSDAIMQKNKQSDIIMKVYQIDHVQLAMPAGEERLAWQF